MTLSIKNVVFVVAFLLLPTLSASAQTLTPAFIAECNRGVQVRDVRVRPDQANYRPSCATPNLEYMRFIATNIDQSSGVQKLKNALTVYYLANHFVKVHAEPARFRATPAAYQQTGGTLAGYQRFRENWIAYMNSQLGFKIPQPR